MKPKDARKSLGILLNPFYFCAQRPISKLVFPATPVEREANIRSGRLAILRVTEWLPLPSEIAEFLRGFDLATSPDWTALWTYIADTGRCEARPVPTGALDKLLDGVPEEQPTGDVKPLEPEDFAAIMDFDEE